MTGRQRIARAFLWLAVLAGGPLVGAELFDLLALAGAWSANPPASLAIMPYGRAWPVDTGAFFIPFSAAMLVAGFGALVAGWRTPWRYRWLLCVLLIGILLLVLTVVEFWPPALQKVDGARCYMSTKYITSVTDFSPSRLVHVD